jgi:hypothetical protein
MSALTGLIIIVAIMATYVTLCFVQDLRGLRLPWRSR